MTHSGASSDVLLPVFVLAKGMGSSMRFLLNLVWGYSVKMTHSGASSLTARIRAC